ncbi:hypothetical protein BMS3Abin03_01157 [bacterium BMS3Abin03]|nr:hypothetical protein BMS3Abin03_01157 [bacterium BMS3Abin03]
MKIKINKKTTVQLLFAAAVILLIANLVIKNFFIGKVYPQNFSLLTGQKIDSIFISSLKSYGILDEWIDVRKVSGDEKYKNYKIQVPADLSIPVILTEIYANLAGYDVNIFSQEKKPSGKSILTISVADEVKLKSVFNYNDAIKRIAGRVSFIINDFVLWSSEDSLLLQIPEPFSILLTPSKENTYLAEKILKMKKSYSVLLNDDISELKYKLRDNYSKNRLENSIKSLIKDYSKATFFVIDEKSDIFNSFVLQLLRNEFSRRKINLIRKDSFIHLNYDNEDELKSLFDTYLKQIKNNGGKIFLIDEDGFISLLPEIRNFRKTGYKFVHPSEIKIIQ